MQTVKLGKCTGNLKMIFSGAYSATKISGLSSICFIARRRLQKFPAVVGNVFADMKFWDGTGYFDLLTPLLTKFR
jgi:hypothetical protein